MQSYQNVPPQSSPSLTEIFPLSSRKIHFWKSGILVPGIVLAVLGLSLLGIGACIIFMLFWVVYVYSGTTKPLAIYLVPALMTALLTWLVLRSPIWNATYQLFESIRPGLNAQGAPLALVFLREFFDAGLTEELTKALPILICLAIGLGLDRSQLAPGSSRVKRILHHLAVRTPLDGVLIGLASGAGFLVVANFFYWVPRYIAEIFQQTNVDVTNLTVAWSAGVLSGFQLMIFSAVQGLSGPMAWAAINGYFIGLAYLRRAAWPITFVAIGWISTSVLHGLWNTASNIKDYGPYVHYIVAVLGFLYFLACLLKARQLEPRLAGDALAERSAGSRESGAPSLTEILPISSANISIRKSRLLVPGIATALLCVFLFENIGITEGARRFTNALGAYIIFMLFWMVYTYSGTRKPLAMYAVPALMGALFIWLSPLLWMIYLVPQQLWRAQQDEPIALLLLRMFLGPGLCEELVKAVPILIGLGIALKLGRPQLGAARPRLRRILDWFAVRTPLDGILVGLASGGGFTIMETFFLYVPATTAEMIKQTNMETAGLLGGLALMIFRVMDGFGGHMAWSATNGYFIGLAYVRRAAWPLLLAVGWLSTGALHALWDTAAFGAGRLGGLVFYVLCVIFFVGFMYFLACLLKARQLEPELAGGAMKRVDSIATAPISTTVTAPAGATGSPASPQHAAAAPPATAPAIAAVPFMLLVEGTKLPLVHGRVIDLASVAEFGSRATGIVAEVTSEPSDPDVLRLTNLGNLTWNAKDARTRYAVPPGRSVPLATGTRIDFGPLSGDIDANIAGSGD
jgi:RsiW-degrading membrane proteinase PrsW (M82 family)